MLLLSLKWMGMNIQTHPHQKKTLKKYPKSSLTEKNKKKTIICFLPRGYIFLANTCWCADLFQIWISHPFKKTIPLEGPQLMINWDPDLPSPSLSWVEIFDTHHPLRKREDRITMMKLLLMLQKFPNNHRLDGAKTLINWLAGFLPRSSTPNHCAQSHSKRRWCQDPIVLKSSACLGVLFLFSFAGGEKRNLMVKAQLAGEEST